MSENMSLSRIETIIEEFNSRAIAMKTERDKLVEMVKEAGLGTRFARRYLASVTVKMPDEK